MEAKDVLDILLPLIGATAVSYLFYVLALRMAKNMGPSGARRVEEIASANSDDNTQFGSEEHRLRVAFARFGVKVSGHEKNALQIARIVVGVIVFLVLSFVIGLPLLPSLLGFAGGWLAVNGIVDSSWKSVIKKIEEELPYFVIGFSSTIQVTQSVLDAIEEETQALEENSPLKEWLLTRFVKPCHEYGRQYVPDAVKEADALSSSLGVVAYLIGRVWEVGGAEWQRAFASASSNIEGVLEAKATAQETAQGVRGSVSVIASVTIVMMIVMIRNPAVNTTMSNPLVQFGYGMAIILMVVGYFMINDMVDSIG